MLQIALIWVYTKTMYCIVYGINWIECDTAERVFLFIFSIDMNDKHITKKKQYFEFRNYFHGLPKKSIGIPWSTWTNANQMCQMILDVTSATCANHKLP